MSFSRRILFDEENGRMITMTDGRRIYFIEFFQGIDTIIGNRHYRNCKQCHHLQPCTKQFYGKVSSGWQFNLICKNCERNNKSSISRGFKDFKDEQDFYKKKKSYLRRNGISDYDIKVKLGMRNKPVPKEIIEAKRIQVLINKHNSNEKQRAKENLKYLRS